MINKRALFVMMVVLLVIVALIISIMLITKITSIELERENNFDFVSENDLYTFLNGYKGRNILFLDETSMADEISKALPYVKVTNIERVFPSRVVITVEERLPFYYIFEDSKYYVFDREFILLEVTQDIAITDKAIALEGFTPTNLTTMEVGVKATEFEGKEKEIALVVEYIDYMLLLDYNYDEAQLTRLLDTIEISFEKDLYITDRRNISMAIFSPNTNLSEKIRYVMGAYSTGFTTEPGNTIYIGDDLKPTLSSKDVS